MQNVLGCLISLSILSGCATKVPDSKPESIVVKYVETPRPAPIVPPVDQLDLRTVSWEIITPENADEKFAEIKNGQAVFFAITSDGYKALAMNLSDIRANIEQYKKIIAVYEDSYK
jgi:hypothetical protein